MIQQLPAQGSAMLVVVYQLTSRRAAGVGYRAPHGGIFSWSAGWEEEGWGRRQDAPMDSA